MAMPKPTWNGFIKHAMYAVCLWIAWSLIQTYAPGIAQKTRGIMA